MPFSFRLLLSGDPRLCSSLISDGFEDAPPEAKTRLNAISSDYELGVARFQKFAMITAALARDVAPGLAECPEGSVRFLKEHRDRYLLLETIELDMMSESQEDALRACVEQEIATCAQAGAAIDALSSDAAEAGRQLKRAVEQQSQGPLKALFGLRLDAHFDDARGDDATEYPMGLSNWSDVLYFSLSNRAEFEEPRRA